MKINGSFLRNLNTQGGTGKFKLFKTKKAAIIASASLFLATTLGIGGALVGCSNQNQKNDDQLQTEVVSPVDTSVDEKAVKDVDDKFTLLADRLNISNLTMTDRLSAKIEAEVQAQLEAVTPEGQTVFKPSEVHFADDGSAWVSEDDYNEYIEHGEQVTIASGYLAPDGNVWASEADYLAYINGQHESTVIVEGNFYTAPDGSVWTSEDEYKAYVSSNNGTIEIPVENGEIVEFGEGYRAPDGSYWTSKEDYEEFVKGQKEGTSVDNTGIKEETGKGETVVEGNFYTAPDGSVWSSKEDYEDYMNSLNGYSVQDSKNEETVSNQTTVESDVIKEETGKGETVVEGNFYTAPDGSIWASEDDYLAYIQGTVSTTSYEDESSYEEELSYEVTTNYQEESSYVEESVVTETVTETITEEAPVIEESGNFYTDEDGNVWASYEDYLAYMESLGTSKTK